MADIAKRVNHRYRFASLVGDIKRTPLRLISFIILHSRCCHSFIYITSAVLTEIYHQCTTLAWLKFEECSTTRHTISGVIICAGIHLISISACIGIAAVIVQLNGGSLLSCCRNKSTLVVFINRIGIIILYVIVKSWIYNNAIICIGRTNRSHYLICALIYICIYFVIIVATYPPTISHDYIRLNILSVSLVSYKYPRFNTIT